MLRGLPVAQVACVRGDILQDLLPASGADAPITAGPNDHYSGLWVNEDVLAPQALVTAPRWLSASTSAVSPPRNGRATECSACCQARGNSTVARASTTR